MGNITMRSAEERSDVFQVDRLRRCAIEVDLPDERCGRQERCDVVGNHGAGNDIRVQAGRPGAGVQNVPQRKPFRPQQCCSFHVAQGARNSESAFNDCPESVSRVSVVFACLE